MNIPRGVLMAGASAFVDGLPEDDPGALAALLIDDPESRLAAAIVAAIEAWEATPVPWGPEVASLPVPAQRTGVPDAV